MLRFFRSIRQKLIEGKNVRSYFIYAIGEVLLVMIGILLALQVNNWNENRKDNIVRDQLVQDLKIELELVKSRLSVTIERQKYLTENGTLFKNHILDKNSTVSVDSLRSLANFVAVGNPFDLTLPSYNEAQSTGKISLLKSKGVLEGYAQILTAYEGWALHRRIAAESYWSGPDWELRKKLGSIRNIFHDGQDVLEPFRIADSEYRQLMLEPEVYAAIDNRDKMNKNNHKYLERMMEGIDQVLRLLEEISE